MDFRNGLHERAVFTPAANIHSASLHNSANETVDDKLSLLAVKDTTTSYSK